MLSGPDSEALFHRLPTDFSRNSPRERLAMALGATLYSPAVRPQLAHDIARCHAEGVMSMVCCLEDAIRDDEVEAAEVNLAEQLRWVAARHEEGPILFVRVRHPEQIYRLADRLGDDMRILSGFVLPKFRADESGLAGITAVREVSAATGLPLYAMPVLESREVAHAETRLGALIAIRQLLDQHRESVLAIRVGATDLCGAYGLRRPAELTAWDIGVVSAALNDIINLFTRRDGTGYVVTGPVWEYFSGGQRVLKPQLRVTPFEHHDLSGRMLRRHLVQQSLDGLIREILLDRANGLTGKTVIHPSHAAAVHALSVVSHEEYCDAFAICQDMGGQRVGGVLRSVYENKMNEVGPHWSWAELTLLRADVFGVAAEGVGFVDFLDACVGAENAA
jgi:citrate lyase beta subunit